MLVLETEIGGAGFDHGCQSSHIVDKTFAEFSILVCRVCVNIIMIHQCCCSWSLPSLLTVLQIVKVTENESLLVANTSISAPITP